MVKMWRWNCDFCEK